MINHLKTCLAIILLLEAVFVFNKVNAQTISPSFEIEHDHYPIYTGETAFVSVIPNNFEASSTVFTWFNDGIPDIAASGKGKSIYKVNTNLNITETAIINLKVSVNPGAGFEKVERNVLIAILPTISPQKLFEQAAKIRVNFSIVAAPEGPEPGQTVKLYIDPIGFDPYISRIEWKINGKIVLSGIGEKEYSFNAGRLGETHRIEARATLPDGASNSKTKTITVMGLSFYWWADTQIPAWYKGKALPAPYANATVMALPRLNATLPQNTIYKWKVRDGFVNNKNSGYGKSTFTFVPQFLGVPERIGVEIINAAATLKKDKSININTATPFVKIYPLKPLEGVDSARTVKELTTGAGSILDFMAEPFFFPRPSLASLSYQWRLCPWL